MYFLKSYSIIKFITSSLDLKSYDNKKIVWIRCTFIKPLYDSSNEDSLVKEGIRIILNNFPFVYEL